MAQRITLRDISERAGVSVTTVSNVLNGKVEQVSPETDARIRQIAEELGYDNGPSLRRRVGRSTMTLGMIVPSFKTHLHADAMTGAESTAARFGYRMLLAANSKGESQERATVEAFLERNVDGIIFSSSSGYSESDALRTAASAEIPCVVINRLVDPDLAYHILVENEASAYQATRHVIRLGHTRIGTIHLPIEGPKARTVFQERYRGFRRALEDHGLVFEPQWSREGVLGDEPGAAAIAAAITREILSGAEAPTALICGSDTMAVGAMRAAHSMGIPIPEKLAVVGFDDTPAAGHLTPTLTTVQQPLMTAGCRAVELLVQTLWKGGPLKGSESLPCRLMVRGSTTSDSYI